MNLVIDIGNTCVKAALFKNNHLIDHKTFNDFNELLADKTLLNQAQHAIICSVVDGLDKWYEKLNVVLPIHLFTDKTKIPLINSYQSISTLGSDRIAAAVGAYSLYPNSNVLVVDAGTCIKYNFTNVHNEYLGGGISPGIQMKFKALHQFTSKLPLIDFDKSFTDLVGVNTQQSILSGVLNGSVAEVDGIINQYKQQYSNLICLLTGGDGEYLANRLKNSIFAHQNLILIGLNTILAYHLENN
ncbi:MAG: type III pantothenate kinase [Bacteroidia bacterium]|nr:type III pantothenate kinase [Bacteroidia bacterium]